MPSDILTELGLRDSPGTELPTALRHVLDRALEIIARALASEEDGDEGRAFVQEVERCRAAFADVRDVQTLESITQSCFAVCVDALARAEKRRRAKTLELNGLFVMVRDAVATIGGYNRTFSNSIGETAQRFDAMSRIGDIRKLKEALATEVTALKQMAVERQQTWQTTVAGFETRLQELELQLVETQHEASLDPLTGVANRRTFDRVCQKWLQTSGKQFVIVMVDLDDFKSINDTFGHPIGDKALIAVADALTAAVRSDDLVARLGGDEFVVLAAGMNLRMAESRMRTVLAELTKSECLPDGDVKLTLSCGIAEASAGDTKESLLKRADQALLDAKKYGKNRVAVRAASFIRDLRKR